MSERRCPSRCANPMSTATCAQIASGSARSRRGVRSRSSNPSAQPPYLAYALVGAIGEYKADVCAEDAFGERPIAAARNDTVADTLLRAGAFGKLTEDDAFYHHLRSVKRIAYKKAFGVPANF
mmetsp:Transcript_74911/g.171706  ORF Transcript_74911/g.171706 Transcript_74911/m.171706 type:complete len:123 (-) Transcript_74911:101-469(-)